MKVVSAVLIVGLATPAFAQDAVDGPKFEALVEGRSLAWAYPGQEPYGLERYYPGRRVLWFRTETRECLEGKWFDQGPPDDPAICFVYQDDPLPHCWRVRSKPDGLRATPAQGGQSIATRLGPEHEAPFGCGHLGL